MRKKSPAKSLSVTRSAISEIKAFIAEADRKAMSAGSRACCYEFAVIWAYREFEIFVLDILVALINRDPSPFYDRIGVNFGANPTAAQCEFLLVGDRYFDFRGHGGLIDVIRKASGNAAGVIAAVRRAQHRNAFEILVGLRNYASHWRDQSKTAALRAMRHWEPNRRNLGRAGKWLNVVSAGRSRMERLLTEIEALCTDMANAV